ncbi:MAG: SEL1-like repeat protein [Cocleimonas sp.]|nr:SEL1-like repeat protein [Cocleimonas sp.]
MSSINQLSHIYNPANQSDEQLLNGFVIRTKPFQKILRELEASKLRTVSQHFLIEGQRGMGKTSLLLRLRIEIEQNPKLSHLLAVQFAEEQYGIYSLCQLWEHVAEALEDTEGYKTLVDELDYAAERSDYPQECFYILEKHLKQNKQQLVLLLDNVGDILARFSEIETSRLRDLFHASPYIQLIAASVKALEATYQHDQPFYEFFKILTLKGLNKKETHCLLEKLAKNNHQQQQIKVIIKNQDARIETIRRLTGGVPRTIVLLYEIFIDESAGVFEDLEVILDRVSPLYKHRMDDLSTQQQAIINTLALNWDGMTTKEITKKLNNPIFTSKKIASQLNQLEKNGWVESKKPDNTKIKVYLLQERFFNIWYLMRYGRKKNKNQVLWLVRFLQEWCDQKELIRRTKRHIEVAKEGRLHTIGGVYMTNALAPLINDVDLQHEFINTTRNALRPMLGDIDKKVSKSDKELYKLASKAREDKNLNLAIKYYKTLSNKGSSMAMHILALLYETEFKDFDQAIVYYKRAIEKDYVDAMYNLALLYKNKLKDFDQAIVYYKRAIEKGHTDAIYNLALLYDTELKDFDRAIVYYKRAIEKDNAFAINNLALLYETKIKDFDQAIVYYKRAIEKDHDFAMNNLAYLYETELKDFDQAIIYYKRAIEKDDVDAMFNLALLYRNKLKDFDQAIVYYKRAIEKDDAEAMYHLAWLYYTQAIKKEEALSLSKKSYSLKKNIWNTHTLATSLLWNHHYQESIGKIKELLATPDDYQSFMDDITDYFLLLLAKQKTSLAYDLFTEYSDLKQQFKPVYYALMTLLKDAYPKEYLKMGTELEETVQEILQKVEEMAVKYE